MDSNRPHNIEKRIRIDNKINEFSNYVTEYALNLANIMNFRKQKTAQTVLWTHGKDTKRIFSSKNYRDRTQKDMAGIIMRQQALKQKLEHEQLLYKQELNERGLALEITE